LYLWSPEPRKQQHGDFLRKKDADLSIETGDWTYGRLSLFYPQVVIFPERIPFDLKGPYPSAVGDLFWELL
jgi:hypothetical protein